MLRLPPPVFAIGYLLIAAAMSYLAGWPLVPGLPLVPLGIALVVLGLCLAIAAATLFVREGTELNPISPSNRKLVTSGPFRFTRNPMYLSLVIVTFGIAVWLGAWPMFLAPIATFATLNWVHVSFEEAKMHNQFGQVFDAYVRKVRRWI
ncbi:MAG: isoprenylcysteine carboxylmethyltransferase family protein [Xanthobacteraceae bacterium]